MDTYTALLHASRIGVWGIGTGGRASLRLLIHLRDTSTLTAQIIAWDDHALLPQMQEQLRASGVVLGSEQFEGVPQFLDACDIVLISQGIDPRPFTAWHAKLHGEIDLFAHIWAPRHTIAVTGTVGKTTTTALIAHLYERLLPTKLVALGGNIGTGMLELPLTHPDASLAVLELSSAQLAYAHIFAPRIGIWTNISPNHLDRHETMEQYTAAKLRLFKNQTTSDIALLGISVMMQPLVRDWVRTTQATVTLVGAQDVCAPDALVQSCARVWGDEQGIWLREARCAPQLLCPKEYIPQLSIYENWWFVIAALYYTGCDVNTLGTITEWPTIIFAHRIEHVATIYGADFYNDSKATVIAATRAALAELAQHNRPIRLILGGTLKGAHLPDITCLRSEVPHIGEVYAFGPAWQYLAGVQWYATLEELMAQVMMQVSTGDIVLFSPSGASYDFFRDYMHRGQVFTSLLEGYAR